MRAAQASMYYDYLLEIAASQSNNNSNSITHAAHNRNIIMQRKLSNYVLFAAKVEFEQAQQQQKPK